MEKWSSSRSGGERACPFCTVAVGRASGRRTGCLGRREPLITGHKREWTDGMTAGWDRSTTLTQCLCARHSWTRTNKGEEEKASSLKRFVIQREREG